MRKPASKLRKFSQRNAMILTTVFLVGLILAGYAYGNASNVANRDVGEQQLNTGATELLQPTSFEGLVLQLPREVALRLSNLGLVPVKRNKEVDLHAEDDDWDADRDDWHDEDDHDKDDEDDDDDGDSHGFEDDGGREADERDD